MKVKIKGLVFVGFAAAILSANAMAASDNTVTSKQYVDTKFQTIANLSTQGDLEGNRLNANSDTTYPSEKMVAAALTATGATVQSGLLTLTQNGQTIGTFSANQNTNSPVTLDFSDTTYSADGTTITKDANNQFSANTTGGVAENGTNLVTGGAVYDALHNTANVGNGALTVTVDGGTVTGSFEANQADPATIAITGLESLSHKVDTINTAASAEQKAVNYPSQAAVEAYVTTQAAASNFVEDQIVDGVTAKAPSQNVVYDQLALKQNANTAVTHTANTAVGDASTPVYIDSTGAAVATTLGTAANANVSTTGVDNGETGLVSGDQVYDYIDSLPAADIPAMPTATGETCDADHPCALVTDNNGAPVWKRIAQSDD